MSLNLRNLSVLAYANGFTLWHYKTTDNDVHFKDAELIEEYFRDADVTKKGDIILTVTSKNTYIITI